jgi:type VI secretion system secreted protein Hcp
MSVDIYLKLSGIPGECEKQGHADEIEILSFSFGANQTGSFHKGGQGGGAGKASISDLNIMKEVDKSSPLLFQACATGRHIPEATIYSQKAGGNNAPVTYYEIKMTDLMVSSHQNSGSGGSDALMETVTFNFARLDFVYTGQTKEGGKGAPVKAFFDVRKAEAG